VKKLLIIALILGLCPAPATAAQCGWDQSPGWVARENQLKGDRGWSDDVPLRFSADYSRRKKMDRIEGYLSATSAGCGERLTLTTVGSKNFSLSVYRMGYYGGDSARLVRKSKSPKSISVNTDMVPGQYLLKLTSENRASSFIPLVVNGNTSSDITFISSVLTWQAYNQWGGKSLYKGPDGQRETKANSVSFDRPYDGDGSGQFRYMEQPLLFIAEKQGLDINYMTDIDVDRSATALKGSKSVVLGGHSEFWTQNMRRNFESAVASGVNLIIFGGNTGYALTTFTGRNVIGRTPFREIDQPESQLLGSQFFALGIHKDLISNNVWPFSALGKDAVIKGVYGYEADTAMGSKGPGVQVLARAAISPTEKGLVAMSTYYKATSGAVVLNMGTNAWVCALANTCPWGHSFDGTSQMQLQKVTLTILQRLKSSKWPLPHIDIPTRN